MGLFRRRKVKEEDGAEADGGTAQPSNARDNIGVAGGGDLHDIDLGGEPTSDETLIAEGMKGPHLLQGSSVWDAETVNGAQPILVSTRVPVYATGTMLDSLGLLNMVETDAMTSKDGESLYNFVEEKGVTSDEYHFLPDDAQWVLDFLAKIVFVLMSIFVITCLAVGLVLLIFEQPVAAKIYLEPGSPEILESHMLFTPAGELSWWVSIPLVLDLTGTNQQAAEIRALEISHDIFEDNRCPNGIVVDEAPHWPVENACSDDVCEADYATLSVGKLGVCTIAGMQCDTVCPIRELQSSSSSFIAFCSLCGNNATSRIALRATTVLCFGDATANFIRSQCAVNDNQVYLNVTVVRIEKYQWFLTTYTRHPANATLVVKLRCDITEVDELSHACQDVGLLNSRVFY